MPGLRDILDTATPPRPIPEWWSDTRLQQTAIAQARLSALAPELAALCLRVNEIVDHAAEHRRDPIDLNYVAIPRDDWELLNAALARLGRLGKGPSDG